MADLEFFFDPVCPWAWITSRWVVEVQSARDYAVEWRFISLRFLNEQKMDYAAMPDGYEGVHAAGTQCLRVCVRAREEGGNTAVAGVYSALGTSIHPAGERDALVADPVGHIGRVIAAAGFPAEWADAAVDSSRDDLIRGETSTALARAGDNVGTPILTFRPGAADEGSFFGPVISSVPRGEGAVRLWDAVEVLATTSGMAELKRSLRSRPVFD